MQVLGSIGVSAALSKSAILAAPALLYPIWGPWIRAGVRNAELYLKQFKSLGLWRAQVRVANVLCAWRTTPRHACNIPAQLAARLPALSSPAAACPLASQVISVDVQVMPYAYMRAAAAGGPAAYTPADSVAIVVGDPWPGGARAQVGFALGLLPHCTQSTSRTAASAGSAPLGLPHRPSHAAAAALPVRARLRGAGCGRERGAARPVQGPRVPELQGVRCCVSQHGLGGQAHAPCHSPWHARTCTSGTPKVVREVYFPQSGLWLADYPFVNRDIFLDISLAVERGRQMQQQDEGARASAGGPLPAGVPWAGPPPPPAPFVVDTAAWPVQGGGGELAPAAQQGGGDVLFATCSPADGYDGERSDGSRGDAGTPHAAAASAVGSRAATSPPQASSASGSGGNGGGGRRDQGAEPGGAVASEWYIVNQEGYAVPRGPPAAAGSNSGGEANGAIGGGGGGGGGGGYGVAPGERGANGGGVGGTSSGSWRQQERQL